MTAPELEPLQPQFLPGDAGLLFSLYRGPATAKTAVVFAPPFAEEMNKSRRMFTLAARELSRHGIASLVIDFFGTGDSAGEFGAARWATWRSDITLACDWLHERGHGRVVLLGLRMGAMLALDVARQRADVSRVMLWQPLLSGEAWVTQFLRTDVVARMLTQADSRSTTDALRARLRDGELIEVAGYALAPELIQALEGLRLEDLAPGHGVRVDWLELVSDPTRGGTLAGDRVRRAWQEQGADFRFRPVVGPPFWSSVEIAVAPELVQATAALLVEAE